MAVSRTFPPCIHCGAQKGADGKPLGKREMIGYANDGEIPIYYVKCLNCGKHFMCFLGTLPAEASLSALDEQLRKRLRESKRKKFGYDGQTKFITRGAKRHDSDRLDIDVKIVAGSISSGLARKMGYTNSTARTHRLRKVEHKIA